MKNVFGQIPMRRLLSVATCWIFALASSLVIADDVSAKHGWSAEGLRTAREYSETLDTAAVVILHHGVTVDEWGATALPLMCHSVRKSLLSALYGRHIENGTIDLNRTLKQLGINDSELSLSEAERGAQIRHLLMARSGVYHPALYETAAMAAARPARGSHVPNTFWYYNNWDFNAAAAIFENLTGRSVFEEFDDQIAKPLGLQDFRRDRDTQYVTGDDSVYPAYPFRLSTRDPAKFGLLFLRNGRWGDEQLIPENWVAESTASYSDAGTSGGYGYMWWVAVDGKHFPGVTLPKGSYSARGYRGQYLLVIPEWDFVICHRVNSFQKGTAVSKTDFGKLLNLIFAARPSAEERVEPPSEKQSEFHLIIRNGLVIDGTGGPKYQADVAVRNNLVAAIGQLADAKADVEIDATGKIVSPGFIDLHSHAEKGLVSDDPARRAAPNLITQGITTVVVNQDGGGPLDLTKQRQQMERLGVGVNVCQVIGHGTVRQNVMGADHQRPATAGEIKQMQQLVIAANEAGGFGMSAGLEYVPGRWSSSAEMEALSMVVAAGDGVTIVHERSSGRRPMWFLPSRDSADQPSMLDNLQDLIDIAAATNVRTVATHIKARGTDVWGSSAKMNEAIRNARKGGLELYADQYAYNTSGSDGRIVLIPSWVSSASENAAAEDAVELTAAEQLQVVLDDESLAEDLRRDIGYEITRRGGAENILIVFHPDKSLNGTSLADYAAELNVDTVGAVIALQLKGDPQRRGGAQLRAFSMSEQDVEAFANTPVLVLFPQTGTSVAVMCNLQGVALTAIAKSIADEVQPAAAPVDYSQAIARLQTAIRHEVESKQLPAFSISLVDGDRTVWADGFGFQDADKKVPATAKSVYRVGSVSKLFTDIAVMQLVESGQLDLEASIQTYVPSFQPGNPFDIPLTLRQMMSHRSGLVRESPVGNYFDPTEPTLAATVASLNSTSLVYKPETKTKYSNAAVAVVGAALESQLEVSHPERVRQTILDPLQMNNSSFVVTDAVRPSLATGWMRTYDGRRFEAPTFLLGTGPAGNLYSSVLDLSKFLVCMFNEGRTVDGQILKPETYRLMTTPMKDADGRPQGFGMGFHVQKLDGYTKIGHGGAVYGFSTQLEALPERKLGVAAAASMDGTNGVVGRLADYALRLMIATQDGKSLPVYRMTGPVPPERAAELVGTYQEVDGDRFTRISELNGDVFMQRGSFRYKLGAAGDDGSIITDDESGFGTEVKPVDGERVTVGDTEFTRLKNQPPANIPAHWKGLIGEYGWDHNTLYILEDNGRLYALIEWFYYYPLQQVSEDVYEFPDYGLYHGEGLKFTRDASGKATSVVAAEVKFDRREVGTKDGETFKIEPLRPIDDLRAGALAASPPSEPGDYRDADLVDLITLDPTIQLDIRYASTNNFTGAVFYKQARAFMQRPAAEAVVRANARLKERGLGLLVHDAYRPWHVTKMFWDATPDELKDFVANPANGSRHNRGCAVDITLYELKSGEPIQMVAGYDEFSPRSFPQYPGGTSQQRWYRELLRRTMEAEGFTIYEYEWWHFDFRDWKKYRIGNVTFEEIDR